MCIIYVTLYLPVFVPNALLIVLPRFELLCHPPLPLFPQLGCPSVLPFTAIMCPPLWDPSPRIRAFPSHPRTDKALPCLQYTGAGAVAAPRRLRHAGGQSRWRCVPATVAGQWRHLSWGYISRLILLYVYWMPDSGRLSLYPVASKLHPLLCIGMCFLWTC